uniref:Uncharacterized protein n=1 Tax=Parascaris univalens TaxID=6257 RepID=A0A915AM24_PARUN
MGFIREHGPINRAHNLSALEAQNASLWLPIFSLIFCLFSPFFCKCKSFLCCYTYFAVYSAMRVFSVFPVMYMDYYL